VEIEFLWWPECPSWERAREILLEEMAAQGIDSGALSEREILEEETARREGFPGSPTIRIDGRDVADPGRSPIGLTCRIYRLRDGRISALPDRADVAEALRAANAGGETKR
jgi:hypothetical protein